jgi:phosphoribosylformylglycinamidine synthase
VTLWEIDVHPRDNQPDLLAAKVASDARDLRMAGNFEVSAARGFLIEGDLGAAELEQIARELFSDAVVEQIVVAPLGDNRLIRPPTTVNGKHAALVHVLPKPGVMDPVAESALRAARDFGLPVKAVRTLRKYWLAGLPDEMLSALCNRILANDAVEQVVIGPLLLDQLDLGSSYSFELKRIPLRDLDDSGLERLSRGGQLYLSLPEMQTIQAFSGARPRPDRCGVGNGRSDLE